MAGCRCDSIPPLPVASEALVCLDGADPVGGVDEDWCLFKDVCGLVKQVKTPYP